MVRSEIPNLSNSDTGIVGTFLSDSSGAVIELEGFGVEHFELSIPKISGKLKSIMEGLKPPSQTTPLAPLLVNSE